EKLSALRKKCEFPRQSATAQIAKFDYLTNGIENQYSSYIGGPYNDDRFLTADGRRLLAWRSVSLYEFAGWRDVRRWTDLARVCFSGGPDGQEVVRWESELRHHR